MSRFKGIRPIPYFLGAVLSFPVMLIFFLMLLTRRSSIIHRPERLPENAFLIAFHPDMPALFLTPDMWVELKKQNQPGGIYYLGSHYFWSYFWGALFDIAYGWDCLRYDREHGKKPYDFVLDFLKQNPKTQFGLRTDSGQPYYKVRTSAVTLAIATNRPVVCFRQKSSPSIKLFKHYFPLPFAKVTTWLSEPISADTLKSMPVEQAVALLQKTMDDLIKG